MEAEEGTAITNRSVHLLSPPFTAGVSRILVDKSTSLPHDHASIHN
jgi:hypothetical protein